MTNVTVAKTVSEFPGNDVDEVIGYSCRTHKFATDTEEVNYDWSPNDHINYYRDLKETHSEDDARNKFYEHIYAELDNGLREFYLTVEQERFVFETLELKKYHKEGTCAISKIDYP
jgi:hypothetical protein